MFIVFDHAKSISKIFIEEVSKDNKILEKLICSKFLSFLPTLYYLLSEQDVISEQGGAKISFST
jgi:hypothetical protein